MAPETEKPPTSSSSSSSTARWKYDVFLSFRGDDTRKNFTDHLYSALHQSGISVFKDDKNLERGKSISEELLQAIQDSRISVIIFSSNYASSTWCLDELAKAFECMTRAEGSQFVLPVFYEVKPSEVKKQAGRYGEAFSVHEQVFGDSLDKVEKWRLATTEVANLSGWDLHDRHQSEVIQEIIEDILKKLGQSCSKAGAASAKELTGIDSRVEQMSSYLGVGLEDVRVIGICGMGGIGKTTIARVFYEKFSSQYESCSFLQNVKEISKKQGLVQLQEQLLGDLLPVRSMKIWNDYQGTNEIRKRLCWRKVLVVLDDVDKSEQLESLVGSRDWFGAGSRIIITTRDERLLLKHGVDNIYRVEGLSHDEALQLFCLKAFKNQCPAPDYVKLSNHVINYANGLPLALNVLGSFLYDRPVKEWRSALSRLKETPNNEIMEKLELSFDGLEEMEKEIFLDIACFYKGMDRDYIATILEGCGFCPHIGISVLKEKSLITITENVVWMHDLLQEMGREIVCRKSRREPGNRGRLWLYEDVSHVLQNDSGTEEVEGIVLDLPQQGQRCLCANAFQRMNRMRLLKMQNVQLSRGPYYLSNELRSLELYKYPSKFLPSIFRPDNLVELNLPHSRIQRLWEETKYSPNLKFMDLSHSKKLLKIKDFDRIPNLEKLNLEGCTRLVEIDETIGVLHKLTSLNLKDCKNLTSLPSNSCNLKSLKILRLYGCSKLDRLPVELGNLTCLEELDVGETGVRQLPSSIFVLEGLRLLSFHGCKGQSPSKLRNFFPFRLLSRKNMDPTELTMHSLSSLCSLKTLDVSYCNLKEGSIPNDLSCFPSLERLYLSGNDFVTVPPSVGRIPKLESLCLANCKMLQTLPDLPSCVQILNMDGCTSVENLPNLWERNTSKSLWLTFTNCSKLQQRRSSIGVSWLKSYLHMLLKSYSQGTFDPESEFFMCLPGSEIPGWFEYQSVGNSLNVELPKKWCNHEWMGFAICAIFGPEKPSAFHGEESEHCSLKCFLRANIDSFPCYGFRLHITKETHLTSDQLWLHFIPGSSSSRSDDWWNTCSSVEVSFLSKGLKVKNCGIQIVYERDIEELVHCRRQHLRNHVSFSCQKRSREECYNYDSVWGEHTENSCTGKHLHCKRLGIPVDPKLKL